MSKHDEVVRCFKVNLEDKDQGKEVLRLLNGYALDPTGGEEPLSDYVQQNLIKELRRRSDTCAVFIASMAVGEGGEERNVGLATTFMGFSTFAARPLLNIHDFVVSSEFRCKGVGTTLMRHVEEYAIENGCCKLTLEVLSGNKVAQNLYRKCGFGAYQLLEETGNAMFWQKKL